MEVKTIDYIGKLATYLKDKCAPYVDPMKEGTIEWLYTSDVHSPNMNPQGLVSITNVTPVTGLNINYVANRYFLNLRLLVSESSIEKQILNLQTWRNRVADQFIRELKQTGYEGYFKNIVTTNSTIHTVVNPDQGTSGAVFVNCVWNTDAIDYGFTTFL